MTYTTFCELFLTKHAAKPKILISFCWKLVYYVPLYYAKKIQDRLMRRLFIAPNLLMKKYLFSGEA